MRPYRVLFFDLIFILIIILLLFISFLSYQRITRLNKEYNLVNHTHQVKLKLGQGLSYLTEAETAQRGFILTRDSSFLQPYKPATENIQGVIQDIDSLTVDNPVQQYNLQALQKLIRLRLNALNEVLKNPDTSVRALKPYLMEGQLIMDQVRGKAGEMNVIEDQLLKERIEIKNRSAAITPFYFLVSSILAIGILMFAYFRLRSESKLRFQAQDSEARIHNFFNEAPAMLAILKGPEHRFEFANPSYMDFINDQNPVGKTFREVMPDLVNQQYYDALHRVYESGEPFVGKEMAVISGDKKNELNPIYLNFIYQAFGIKNGKPEGILVFCYDVSEQVLSRKKIEEAEYRTRLAIEAAELGTFDWDLKNQQFLSSPRLLEIFGFRGQFNISHQNLIDCFHPADKLIRDKAVAESFSKGSLEYEARVIWPNKTTRWIRVYGKVVYGINQELERMYGTAMDISIQKTILDELKESETRFRLLADSMPQLIWTGDSRGDLNYFNQAVYAYSGHHSESLQNKGWLSIVHPDDRNENVKRWLHAVNTGNEFIYEHRFLNKDGGYRWMLSRALAQRDKDGKIQMWVGTSTDIDDQKNFMSQLEQKVAERTRSLEELNQRLGKTIQELERSNTELESFSYIASHDLQEPLRKIIAFSTRIAEKEKEHFSEFSKDYFNRITGAASRMQELIDAFLAYSRTNSFNSIFEPTNLNTLVSEIIDDLIEIVEEKKAIIEYDRLPTVKVISIQFYQLLNNLISNSLKYSKSDVQPIIKIAAERIQGDQLKIENASADSEYWKITIEDNGIGFEQQYAFKIFELFQRLHGKLDYTGTGIGLAICKKIVTNHNGFITATGMTDIGAIFNIFIPLRT